MKFRTLIVSVFSLLLFLAGVLLEIGISASVLWGEIEARLYTSQFSNSDLTVKCPLMLAFDETGIISASIIDTLDQDVQPMVTADISRNSGAQQISQTVT